MELTTDSEYVKKGITEWVHGWKRRDWKTADRKPVKNADLWQLLDAAAARHEVSWHWVRGHEGHPQNEYANYLATRAAREQSQSNGIVASMFNEWLAAERTKGRMHGHPQPFPDAGSFRAQRPYPTARPPTLI